MKIAIVDDSGFSRNQIRKALNEYFNEAEIVEFHDGESAMKGVLEANVDMVTLDLVMPKPDGIQVLEALRAGGLEAPIFIISADIQRGTKRRCYELKCSGFLDKPFNKDSLFEALKTHGL